MAYSTERMAKELKAARLAKGLSQRALREMVGVPQSHISKIENGGVDLRLSSLVEIARALDLEVMLVPRKNSSAVKSITRPRPSDTKQSKAAGSSTKELRRLEKTIARISHEHPTTKEIAQLQRRVNDLSRLKLSIPALEQIEKINDSLKLSIPALDKMNAQIDKVSEAVKLPALDSGALERISQSLDQVQLLRNQLVHSQLDLLGSERIRPAYSLEGDDHG